MDALHRVDTFIVDVPIRPHVLAMATMHSRGDGDRAPDLRRRYRRRGRGTTIGGLSYGEESPESIKSAIDTYIVPVLRTCDIARVGATMAKVATCLRSNHFAKCAVENALLDMPVAWTLASGDTARDIAEGEEILGLRRHRIFKLKIGKRDVRADVAHDRGVVDEMDATPLKLFAGAFGIMLVLGIGAAWLVGAVTRAPVAHRSHSAGDHGR